MLYYEEIKQVLEENLKNDFSKMQKSEIEDCVNRLFFLYQQIIGKEGSSSENVTQILKKENTIVSYAYGAYLSNKIAHMVEEKDIVISWENLKELKNLSEGQRKMELQKYAFANKNMFVSQVIQQSKNNSKYKIGWATDRDGRHLLNINVTNYMQYPFQERKKRKFPKDVIISVHVLDPRLSKGLIKLKNYPVRGSKPTEIFKYCNFEGR